MLAVIVALSSLLSELSIQSADSSRLSNDLACLLTGLVPDSLSSNSSTLHSTAAELLSSTSVACTSDIVVLHGVFPLFYVQCCCSSFCGSVTL